MQSVGDLFFDLFWSAYPKRVKKISALREWNRLRDRPVSDILAGIERWKMSDQWQDLQFVPYPERFLKYRRWEDEVPISPLQRELRVGQGPVCNYDAPLKPEVLERIRKRQKAQRARRGSCER